MIALKNSTARQFNIKHLTKDGSFVSLRLKPLMNLVDDSVWKRLAPNGNKVECAYLAKLIEDGIVVKVSIPSSMTDEEKRDATAATKVTKAPKPAVTAA